MTKLEYTFKNDALFNAETEEDLAKLEAMEAPVMTEAVEAYRQVASTEEFKESARARGIMRRPRCVMRGTRAGARANKAEMAGTCE